MAWGTWELQGLIDQTRGSAGRRCMWRSSLSLRWSLWGPASPGGEEGPSGSLRGKESGGAGTEVPGMGPSVSIRTNRSGAGAELLSKC